MVNDLDDMIMLILVDYGMDTHKNLHLVALVSIRLTKTLEKIPFTKTHSSIKPITVIICYKHLNKQLMNHMFRKETTLIFSKNISRCCTYMWNFC